MLRYINSPTSQDFSGIRVVRMVNFCNNEVIVVWLTEAATFIGTVWLIYSVNLTEVLLERALRCNSHRARCECHTVVKGSFKFKRIVEGTWAEDCRSCLWCCLKTWPILEMIFDRGLDEYYWGLHRVMKGNVYQEDSTIPCVLFYFLPFPPCWINVLSFSNSNI